MIELCGAVHSSFSNCDSQDQHAARIMATGTGGDTPSRISQDEQVDAVSSARIGSEAKVRTVFLRLSYLELLLYCVYYLASSKIGYVAEIRVC